MAVQDVGLASSAQQELKRRLAEEVKAHLRREGGGGGVSGRPCTCSQCALAEGNKKLQKEVNATLQGEGEGVEGGEGNRG